ncbi:hypothetical protein V6N13_090697 [Hibiscus sabdariffa]|uniref:F-box domain-containing protein n=1 Tax=Hibiscus sabdariffa TaxID=183260 RepID=A0ABR2BP73_9ROSI
MSSTRRLRQNDHGVPHDLIEDILVKLPVKSLVRFKYVSQQWFRLITDPRFIDIHLSNQWEKGPGFVTASSSRSTRCGAGSRSYMFLGSMVVNRDTYTIPHSDIWLVSVPKDNRYGMLNSCDGILCFHGRFNIWLHNPATKEYRFLPSGPWTWCSCRPHLGWGFGRDLVTKRYKIVRLCNPCPSETGQDHQHHGHCVVFTLDSNPNACWKTIGEVPYKIDVFSQSVYVNGAIYWFTNEFYHLNQAEVIVMFDLHDEKFQAIPHPSSCSNKSRGLMQLGTLRECLCLAHEDVDSLLNIWIMDKQQQKITWEKLYCIEAFRNGQQLIGPRFAFAEHKGGTLLVCTGGVVYLFKPNNEISCLWRGDKYSRPTAFNESLVHVYGRTVTQFKRGVFARTESLVPIYKIYKDYDSIQKSAQYQGFK